MSARDLPCGTVLSIADGKATVRLEAARDGACGSCAHGTGCGIARLNSRRDDIRLQLAAPPGLRAGDKVALLGPKTALPFLALVGYVFPALFMVLGAAFGHLYGGDGTAALFALIAFLLALFLTRLATACLPGIASPSLIPHHTEFPHEQ
jgi:sigma-E factor negative regulatory protein RseC